MNRFSKKFVSLSSILLGSLVISCSSSALGQSLPPAGLGAGPNPKAVMMYNLGITAYKQGSTDAAVIFFKRACDIDPNLADAQYNLAVIYQSQKRYKEAIPRFEEVVRIKPNDPDAHFQLGAILQDAGRPVEARQHFSTIAPNSNHFSEAQRRLTLLGNAAPGAQYPAPQSEVPAYNAPPSNGGLPSLAPAQLQPPYNTGNANPPQGAYSAPPNSIAGTPSTQPTETISTGSVDDRDISLPQSSPVPATPSNPIPVQANTSLRIIATGFNAPAGLAFDKSNNLYVANYLSNSIDRIAPDGTKTQFSSGSTLRGPIGLITDESGNLYVANYSGGTVAKINPAGVSTVIATGFKKPYYLTLDREGNLYVSQQEDNSIVRITLPKQAQAALRNP